MEILYEDNHLLVVEKPVNMPVQGDITGDRDLLSLLKDYVKDKYHKPGEVYLGLVHRLDRPVGGVMVFARTSKAAGRLSAQFSSREARKRYAAIVDGIPPSQGTLTDWLIKDEAANTSRVGKEGEEGAKKAVLRYALIGTRGSKALLDVELLTGRPHQIRVQLKHMGFPISGDQKYNPAARPGEQIKLFAYALTLKHPTLNEEMSFFACPKGPGWEDFAPQTELLSAFEYCRGVYRDEELLVVDKNAGVEVESQLLPALMTLYPGAAPVHRLDANTMGLTVFALNEDARLRLLKRFRGHQLEKIYHAVVRGRPRDTDCLVHYALKDPEEALLTLCPENTPGALRCELGLKVLDSDGASSKVEIDLRTGRTHQIRAQMAAIGCPVLGDDKYGDRDWNKARHVRTQQLLAKRILLEGKSFESLRELSL